MTQTSTITATARVRGQWHSDEASVRFFTGMNEVELCDFKADCAERWFVRYFTKELGLPAEVAHALAMDGNLLRWWNHQWRLMDHYYLLPWLHKVVESQRENVYREFHEGIMNGRHPTATMMRKVLKDLPQPLPRRGV